MAKSKKKKEVEIRCACAHEELTEPLIQETKKIITVDESLCIGCGACIRVGAKGEVADFVMNDSAPAARWLLEIVAEVLRVPLSEIGPLALQSTKVLPSSARPAAFGRGAALFALDRARKKVTVITT